MAMLGAKHRFDCFIYFRGRVSSIKPPSMTSGILYKITTRIWNTLKITDRI
jgi:hypothetical protein